MAEPLDNSMQETDFGPLPSEWPIERLGALIEKPQYGLTASAVKKPSGPRFLRITDIQDGRVDWSNVPSCECGEEAKRKYGLQEGDLVVTRIGATTGKAFLIRESVNAVFASYLIRIRPLSRLSADFLEEFTQTAFYWNQINSAKGGRLKQGVNIPVLQSLAIPVPPIEEQRAIAQVLRTVQQAKEATEKVIAAARQLKRSLMRHLFTYGPVPVERGNQVPLKETEIGPIPEHWQVENLIDLLREPLRNGHSAKASNTNKGIRTLILTAVTQSDFSIHNTKLTAADPERVRGMWLKVGDIFVERANTPEYVGLAALYEGPENYAIYPDLLVRVRVKSDRIVPKFLAEYLLTERCRNYFRSNAKATAGNFPKIDQGVIEQTRVPLPAMEEQQEIDDFLRKIDRKIEAETRRKEALAALFSTLLHHLMTGKVRVQSGKAQEVVA
jgi:type I restriction enzyme S subunit